ncbi:MAG: glycosyltransferase family 39 protein [Candidatus Blackburnbacteria bacterium]|nr:glycosyltransferase family 39 protein [Candidatus Blackburnbacteria bacterium]
MRKAALPNLFDHWKEFTIVGVGILVVAFFLRTYNLLSIPIFADEAIYVRWAQVMKAEPALRFLPLSDGKQPLFMWVTMPFFKIFSDPLVAGRMVSVFAGMGSIVGLFLVGFFLFRSLRVGILASLLWSVSPFSVFFDRMALVDALLASFGIWVLLFAVLTARTMRLDFAMITGFFLGGAWLTKSPAIFFLLLLPSTALVADWTKRWRWGRLGKLGGLWIVSWVIAFAMYNILRLGTNFHMIALRNKDYVFGFEEVLKHPLDPFQFHVKEIVQWFWILLPGTVLIAFLVGLFLCYRKYWREILLLLSWMLFPLLVQSEFAKVFTARYILFTSPPLFLIAALGLTYIPKKFFLPLVLPMLIVPLYLDYLLLVQTEKALLPRVERSGYLEEWTSGTGIREVATYVKKEREQNPNQKIIVGTEGFFGTLPDGLQIYVSDIPGVVVKGVGISISEVDESLVNAKKAGDRVLLVVNSSRFNVVKPEDIGTQLLESYHKAQRPNGTRDSLLLLEVTNEAIKFYDIKHGKTG